MADPTRDRLADLLDRLAAPVHQLHLEPAAQVRARGQRRLQQRRAVKVGSSLTAIAGLVLVASQVVPPSGELQPAGQGTTRSVTATLSTDPAVRVPTLGVQPLGTVGAKYFLTEDGWQGPGLVEGRAITVSAGPFSGVGQPMCDPDVGNSDQQGQVYAAQQAPGSPQREGVRVGSQSVRTTASVVEAKERFTRLADGIEDCYARLVATGRTAKDGGPLYPNGQVREDVGGRVDDATGSVRLYRTQHEERGVDSPRVSLLVIAREGSVLTVLELIGEDPDVREAPIATAVGMRRLAAAARAQIRAVTS